MKQIRVETDLDYQINKLKKAGTESQIGHAGGARRRRHNHDPDGNQVVFVQGNGERHRAVAGKFP